MKDGTMMTTGCGNTPEHALTNMKMYGYLEDVNGTWWVGDGTRLGEFSYMMRVIDRKEIPLPFGRPKWQAVTSSTNYAFTALDMFGQVWKGRGLGPGMHCWLKISIPDTISRQKMLGFPPTRKLPWTPGRIKKRLLQARSTLHDRTYFTPGCWNKREPQYLYSNDGTARLFWKINETTGSAGSVSVEIMERDSEGFWVWPS